MTKEAENLKMEKAIIDGDRQDLERKMEEYKRKHNAEVESIRGEAL